jgi:hypothetical protein
LGSETDSQSANLSSSAPAPDRRRIEPVPEDARLAGTVDFDLHGIVGVRLLGATPADVAAVRRQLGPIEGRLAREPDIEIRFVDRLKTSSRLRLLDLDDAGFTDDGFVVLQSRYRTRARAQIAFEQIGGTCRIVCEAGLPGVPLLIPILNLTALVKGVLPLHASAFTYDGTGVLATGWSKGGKTETLLAFMNHGAAYVGDEWVYLMPEGGRMFGIPEPMRIWDWHLDDLPAYRERIGWRNRSRLAAIRLAQEVEAAVPRLAGRNGRSGLRGRVMPLVARQRHARIHPEHLFGNSSCALAGTLDRVFLLVSHESDEVKVEPIDPLEIARRMVFSLQHERLDFLSYYLKFRFAFPDTSNAVIEQAEETEREALARALAGKPAWAVYHPYPAPIPALFERMAPLLD